VAFFIENVIMDRDIPEEKIRSRRRKRIFQVIVGILLLVLILWLFSRIIDRPVHRSKLLFATAIKGDIEATLNASGVVIPEFEEVISCPIQARIKKINLSAGSNVDSGQSIIQLDKEYVLMEYQKLLDQLELSKTQMKKTRFLLERTISDLDTRKAIKVLKNERLRATYNDTKELFKIGGGTKQEVEIARVNYEIGVLELEQLEKELSNKKESMGTELKELELKIRIQQKNVNELERKLQQADVVSSRNGVVTWVKDQIGANVMPGEIVAKIADLGSYKLEGSISNIFADQIHIGQEAVLRINEAEIRGNIINIDPSVRNGLITFSVVLNENNHPLLRPQIKVEVFVVTDSKKDVIKVPNGPAFTGATNQILFVTDDDRAYRRNVTTGLNNFDFVEIVEGIQEGDDVIISDMKRFDKRERLRIK